MKSTDNIKCWWGPHFWVSACEKSRPHGNPQGKVPSSHAFTATLFITDPTGSNPNVFQQGNGYTNCGTSTRWNTAQQQEGKEDGCSQWLRSISKSKWKKLVSKGYLLCDCTYMVSWKRTNSDRGKISGSQGLGKERGEGDTKEQRMGTCWVDQNVPCPDCGVGHTNQSRW